jgi:hypothetical protein
MKKLCVLLLLASSTGFGQVTHATIYIEPQQGFETYLAAAISKKAVPVDVVTDQTKANYVLRAAPVEIKTESTGGKIARCLFAYCAGIEDKGNVSVQFIGASSTKVLWAYSVNKQKGGSKNSQSMAEAVAKHLKEFIEHDSGKGLQSAAALETTTTQPKLVSVSATSQTEPQVDPTPAAELVSIVIKSTPSGCDINVDGKWMGNTPSTIGLTPGEHNISIEKNEMRPWQRTMTVTAGGSFTIDATLEKP